MSDQVKVRTLTNKTYAPNESGSMERLPVGAEITISMDTFKADGGAHFALVGEAPKSKAKPKAAEAEAEAPQETASSRTPREESAPVMPSAKAAAPAKG